MNILILFSVIELSGAFFSSWQNFRPIYTTISLWNDEISVDKRRSKLRDNNNWWIDTICNPLINIINSRVCNSTRSIGKKSTIRLKTISTGIFSKHSRSPRIIWPESSEYHINIPNSTSTRVNITRPQDPSSCAGRRTDFRLSIIRPVCRRTSTHKIAAEGR